MCPKIEEEECHQIDHCQLVSGANNECTCQDPCQNHGEPVCGSDHVTYRDSCQLKNAACGKHLNITQISDVPCGKNSTCSFHELRSSSPELGISCMPVGREVASPTFRGIKFRDSSLF